MKSLHIRHVPLLPCATVLMVLLTLSGCERRAPLPGGYTVFTASSQEVGLSGGKYQTIVAGPKLTRIGASGTLIFGEIAPRPDRPPADSDRPGFFILDTTTEAIEKGLTREAWLQKLRAAGITEEPKVHTP